MTERRIQHNDIPPKMLEEAAQKFGTMICALTQIPRERLKEVIMFDPGMEGRTGVALHFEPELSDTEQQNVSLATELLCAMVGVRPPIHAARA